MLENCTSHVWPVDEPVKEDVITIEAFFKI